MQTTELDPRNGPRGPRPQPRPSTALAPGSVWRLSWLVAAIGLAVSSAGCPGDSTPADGTGTDTDPAPNTSGPTSVDSTAAGPDIVCIPFEVKCNGQGFLDTCAPTGLEWLTEPCPLDEWCDPCLETESCTEDKCVGVCDVEAELPSSAGCSFIANRQLHLNQDSPDGLVVANPNEDLEAEIQLYETPEGTSDEVPVGDPITLPPGTDHLFELSNDFVIGTSSMFRTGGTFRVESDVPIIAYLHSPLTNDRGNDSSMLLPESTLRRDYVVFSYYPHAAQAQGQGQPSYFEIIALEDFTEVTWTPTYDTAGTGLNIDFVPAGEESNPLSMNRFDTVRIAASQNDVEGDPNIRDLSGTVIHANKPIWVMGASRCSRVPVREFPEIGRCDPLQEMLIPLDYWGQRYVCAASPDRETERHYWRIYSSKPGVRITTSGNLACTEPIITAENCTAPNEFDGEGCTFEKRGSWIEVSVPNQCSFYLEGGEEVDGAIMPVQYLQSSRDNDEDPIEFTNIGDPAMYQMPPVEQFLDRYVFATGRYFDIHYVQVIREQGGPSVFISKVGESAVSVSGFNPVSDTYEVANFRLGSAVLDYSDAEGSYVIESGAPFGIVQVGYSTGEFSELCANMIPGDEGVCHSSYAYPGGMRSVQINIP